MAQVKPEIFREYDIRGHESELDDKTVFLIGRAFGSYVLRNSGGTITLGMDNRASSERIKKAFIKGVLSTGCNIIDIGIVPIPALYFSIVHLRASGGAMITGSHLAKEFNGFKLSASSNALTLYGEQIAKLRELIIKEDFEEGKGRIHSENVLNAYVSAILRRAKLERELSLVVDCGNGCSSLVAEQIFKGIGCKLKTLYCKSDGNFPNHHPDPVKPENLKELIKQVKKSKAELGIAFDGDSDRIGVVDENGSIIWGDYLLALFAKDLLKRKPGAKIVFDVKCSQALPELIEAYGGIPIMYKTGHSLIKRKMYEEDAMLAGEMSGHMFFRDNYFGFDDALFAGAKLCELLSKQRKPLSELIADMPKYYATPEIRVACSENEKWRIVEKVRDYFSKQYEVITIDGARVLLHEGWFLVRASNTSAKIIVRAEARTEHALKEILRMLEKKLCDFGLRGVERELKI
ncbi:MAG: phosphomannomutase/phosphoglucomutase [Candidatus Diapherotrites archaeon]|nr:phosphomannomutase/phosphoglucomutase [Candidatus Diapherotrites archaeon]